MAPQLIPDAVFYSLQYFIPLMFLLRVVGVESPYLNLRVLIVATNICILIAGLLTFFIPVVQFAVIYFGGVEEDRYAFVNQYIGPFGMFAWLDLLSSVVVPQLMWGKNFRRSAASTYVWLLVFLVFKAAKSFLLKYGVSTSWAVFVPEKNMADHALQAVIFIAILIPVYLLVRMDVKRKYGRPYSANISSKL